MKLIKKLINEKNNQIIFHHQKKDIEALSRTLFELKIEQENIKEDLNSVNYLLDLISENSITELDNLTNEVVAHENFNKWIEQIKLELEKLYSKSSELIKQSDIEFINSEKIKLIAEQKRIEKQLSYLNAIISKTTILLKDLQENYCIDLTKGFNLAKVSKKLLIHFGKNTTLTTYTSGRSEIINFLENTFSIDKKKSKQLFDLLEQCNVYKYVVDSTLLDIMYYTDIGNNNTVPLAGKWIMNTKNNY
jgi:hypothetical protein